MRYLQSLLLFFYFLFSVAGYADSVPDVKIAFYSAGINNISNKMALPLVRAEIPNLNDYAYATIRKYQHYLVVTLQKTVQGPQ